MISSLNGTVFSPECCRARAGVADPDPPGVAAGGQSVWSLSPRVVEDCGHPRGLQHPQTFSANQEDEHKYLKLRMAFPLPA